MTATETIASTAAERLQIAADRRQPCEPVRDLLGETDLALAYRVQQLRTQRHLAQGARIVGYKIGLTSPAVQRQLGVNQPDVGVLFDDMECATNGVVPRDRLLQPKVEAEIAFVLGEDLDHDDLDIDRVRGAIDYAVTALEIADSRIRAWDITITDTIADNASSGMFALSTRRVSLADFEPRDVKMSLSVDGAVASTGTGRDCLGDPLAACLWLARTVRGNGGALHAGDLVLSGALGPMVAGQPGSILTAEMTVLGGISVTFK